jgi:hypothetical protein
MRRAQRGAATAKWLRNLSESDLDPRPRVGRSRDSRQAVARARRPGGQDVGASRRAAAIPETESLCFQQFFTIPAAAGDFRDDGTLIALIDVAGTFLIYSRRPRLDRK